MYWNYIITFTRSNLILTCHHTCKLYSINWYWSSLWSTIVCTTCVWAKITMLIVNLFHVLFTICQICMILMCFLGAQLQTMCAGGCNWNMSNIFWEMFYNIIYHLFDGGFISFWIIPLPYYQLGFTWATSVLSS